MVFKSHWKAAFLIVQESFSPHLFAHLRAAQTKSLLLCPMCVTPGASATSSKVGHKAVPLSHHPCSLTALPPHLPFQFTFFLIIIFWPQRRREKHPWRELWLCPDIFLTHQHRLCHFVLAESYHRLCFSAKHQISFLTIAFISLSLVSLKLFKVLFGPEST